jgi:hypothetical protein
MVEVLLEIPLLHVYVHVSCEICWWDGGVAPVFVFHRFSSNKADVGKKDHPLSLPQLNDRSGLIKRDEERGYKPFTRTKEKKLSVIKRNQFYVWH